LTARARQAWLSCPLIGPRFDQLVSILREAAPASPTPLARTLFALVECEALDEGWRVKQEDRDTATALTAMPDTPLPLAAAVLICVAPDGYPTAAQRSPHFTNFMQGLWRQRLCEAWPTTCDTRRTLRRLAHAAVAATAAARRQVWTNPGARFGYPERRCREDRVAGHLHFVAELRDAWWRGRLSSVFPREGVVVM